MTRCTFPFEPVEKLVDAADTKALAAALGVNHGSIRRWRRDGIPWSSTDRVAVAAGVHPALVWDDWIDHSIRLNDELCDDPGLGSYTHRRCRCMGCRDAMRQANARASRRKKAA